MKHQVLKTIDAVVRYVAEIEAETPEQAAKLAYESEEKAKWEFDSTTEYDARNFVTLDADGNEVEETKQGDTL